MQQGRSLRLLTISLNNLKRRKGKAFFILFGLLLPVATVVSFISILQAMQADLDKKLDEVGANILISPESEGLTLNYAGIVIPGISYELKELTTDDVAKIRTIKNRRNINIVSPKLIGEANVENIKAPIAGVLFKEELKLKKWWEVKGSLPNRSNQVLLGSEAAKRLKKKIGDKLTIQKGVYYIKGIIQETGSQDDGLIFLNLNEAQKTLGKPGKISLIEVAAWCFDCPIEEITQQLQTKLPQAKVAALKQVISSKMTTTKTLENFASLTSVLLFIISSMIVLVTMTSSVTERTKEIGVFRAIGFRQSHIMKIILLEALILSLVSGFAGYFLGMGGTIFLETYFTHLDIPIAWKLDLALLAEGLALLVGITASLYPAWQASRLEPVKALRYL